MTHATPAAPLQPRGRLLPLLALLLLRGAPAERVGGESAERGNLEASSDVSSLAQTRSATVVRRSNAGVLEGAAAQAASMQAQAQREGEAAAVSASKRQRAGEVALAALARDGPTGPKAGRYVLIRGVSGINAEAVNGDYVATGHLYNGKMLFRKDKDDDRWLRYVTVGGLNQWRVSSTKSLEADDDKGYLYSAESNLEDPADSRAWFAWSGQAWEPQDDIVVISEGSVAAFGGHAPSGEQVTQNATATAGAQGADFPPSIASPSSSSAWSGQLARWMAVFTLLFGVPLGCLLWLLYTRRGTKGMRSMPGSSSPPVPVLVQGAA